MKPILICTVGFPGAGKGVFVRAAKGLGIPTYIMGDIIRERTKEEYGCDDAYYTGLFMKKIREEYGRDVVAILTLDKIERENMESPYILIDGVRNIEELNYFIQRGYRVILIGVLASLNIRYRRIVNRGRADDVQDISEFLSRENRERKIGLLEVIRHADYYFINEYISEMESVKKARNLLKIVLSEED